MDGSSRYWEMYIIDFRNDSRGYKNVLLDTTKKFFQRKFPDWATKEELSEQHHWQIQIELLSCFRGESSDIEITNRIQAGFCLRCYVSQYIFNFCKRKTADCHQKYRLLRYQDLLPFVLNDDGKTQIILDCNGKTQLVYNNQSQFQTSNYEFFTVEILSTFKLDPLNPKAGKSLKNWSDLKTQQNEELKTELSDWGVPVSTNWALLNRVKPFQLKSLPQRQETLVQIFRAVYRRDRRSANLKGKCKEPTTEQLEEMLVVLAKKGISINSPDNLLKELEAVAKTVNNLDKEKPIDITIDNGENEKNEISLLDSLNFNKEQPKSIIDDIAEQELIDFFKNDLEDCVADGIKKVLENHITTRSNSPSYSHLAHHIKPAYQLIYCQSQSQNYIAANLTGFTNQAQVRRFLGLKEIIERIRDYTVDQFLTNITNKAQEEMKIIREKPDDLNNLMRIIEEFVNDEFFNEALAEITTSKKCSRYAELMRRYLGCKEGE